MLQVRALPLEPFNKVVGGQRLLRLGGLEKRQKTAKCVAKRVVNEIWQNNLRTIQIESDYYAGTAR